MTDSRSKLLPPRPELRNPAAAESFIAAAEPTPAPAPRPAPTPAPAEPPAKRKTSDRRGPRGGRTTVGSSGDIKMTFYLPANYRDALRTRAFREDCPLNDVVLQALSNHLGLSGVGE